MVLPPFLLSGALRGASGLLSGALRGASGLLSGALRGASGLFSGALRGASGGPIRRLVAFSPVSAVGRQKHTHPKCVDTAVEEGWGLKLSAPSGERPSRPVRGTQLAGTRGAAGTLPEDRRLRRDRRTGRR